VLNRGDHPLGQEALFEQLKSPRRRERRAAARQLGELEEQPTAQALAYLILETPNLSLSRTAAEQLARLNARCAKACLLQDAVYKIPHWAANEQLPKALAGSLGYHQGSAEALVDNVVIALQGALEPAIVWAAAKALLRRKDELTRRLASRLLGSLQVPQAVSSLRRIVRTEEGLLRSEAASALDQIMDTQPLPSRKL
jgi:HEAT repeat protein